MLFNKGRKKWEMVVSHHEIYFFSFESHSVCHIWKTRDWWSSSSYYFYLLWGQNLMTIADVYNHSELKSLIMMTSNYHCCTVLVLTILNHDLLYFYIVHRSKGNNQVIKNPNLPTGLLQSWVWDYGIVDSRIHGSYYCNY